MIAGANSIERVLAILDLFGEERLEWTPEEIMDALGYTRPTVYRYLKALSEFGLLTSLPSAGFTLGPRVVEMDFLMRQSDALTREGRPHLEALAARYPATALLARWYGEKLLCVEAKSSTASARSSYARGRPMPLARGAISRAILAHLPRRQLAQRIVDNFDDLRDIGLGDSVEAIAESFRRVRRDGYAIARGEVTPGVVGVAAPVFDSGQSPIAALCVTIAEEAAAAERLVDVVRDVTAAAQALSAALSGRRSGVAASLELKRG